MAKRYGSTFAAQRSGSLPQQVPDGRLVANKRRSTTEIFTLAGQANGDLLFLGVLPIGAVLEGVEFNTDTSLGTATLSVGSEASPAKYAAAATLTATDTPTLRAKASAQAQAPLTAPEEVWATIGTAALPGSGTLVIALRWKDAA